MMPPAELLLTFLASSTLLSLAPGPDNLYVLTQSALQGPRTGLCITLGLCTGLLFHTTAVALGVAALVMLSATAFLLLKLAGTGYLLWLAVGAWRAGTGTLAGRNSPRLSPRQYYLRGILMNLSNPKVAIFFLAFLPQFASPDAGPMFLQLIVLGLFFILVALVVFALIALSAGQLAQRLLASARAQALLNRGAAVLFAGLAARLALSSR